MAFNFYFEQRPNLLKKYMLGGQLDLPRLFWDTVLARDDPRIAGHPLRDRHNWKEKTIPIAVHADAVPCVQVGKAKSKSLDVWSWQSLPSLGNKCVELTLKS